MRRKILINMFFLCLFLSSPLRMSSANPGQDHVEVAVPIISQLVHQDENGKWQGPLIDLLKRAEQEIGIPFHLRMVPFKRAVVMVEEGDTDFGVFLESPKRNQVGMPIVKLGDAQYIIVSLKDKPIHNLSELENKSVARIRGGAEIKTLKGVPGLKYYYFNNHRDGTHLLQYGRVDALVTADFRLLDAVDQNIVTFAELAEPVPLEPRELWLYWSWKSNLDFSLVRRLKSIPNLHLDPLNPAKLRERYLAK